MTETESRIRTATPADREGLLDLIDTAFSPKDGPRRSFAEELPHLFTDARMGCHWIYEEAGKILGCIGLYPYDFRAGNVTFHAAGVGQVCTRPDARGKGIMSTLLRSVCREADQYDFTYLWGDRLRYGRYGWAMGGATMRFETFDKYLPAPPPEEQVRSFEPSDEVPMLQAALAGAPEAIVMDDDELSPAIRGRHMTGRRMGDSFLLIDRSGKTVLLADGDAEEIALLLAHLARELRRQPGDQWRIVIECSPEPSPLLAACQRHYWQVRRQPAGMFRAGDLEGLLGKLAALRNERIPGGSDRLSFVAADTKRPVTLTVADGKVEVTPAATDEGTPLPATAISALCFGVCPPDLVAPLAPDSPFRAMLPWPLHVSHLFGL